MHFVNPAMTHEPCTKRGTQGLSSLPDSQYPGNGTVLEVTKEATRPGISPGACIALDGYVAMNIESLISHSTPPLKPTDTVEFALGLLMEFRVGHLPVVDRARKLIGVVSEERLLNAAGPDMPLESLLSGEPIFAAPDTHVFDVTKVMIEHDMTALPVADAEGRYLGLVRRHDIFEQFARMLSTHEAGAILALDIEARDYSLSQLVYTIEQSDVRVLSLATETEPHAEGRIRVTLKLNATDVARVRHMLEHHGYHIVATFGEDEDDEDLLYRIQEFMRYLEV